MKIENEVEEAEMIVEMLKDYVNDWESVGEEFDESDDVVCLIKTIKDAVRCSKVWELLVTK